jgi:hypothetical protein
LRSRKSTSVSKLHNKNKILACTRPWRPIGLWDVEAPTFSRQSAHRWRWGCQPYAPPALYLPGRFLVLMFVRGWVDPRAIVRQKWLSQLTNPMTSSGIELARTKTNIEMNILSGHNFDFISKYRYIVLFQENVILCCSAVKFGERLAFRRKILAGNKSAETGENLS